jgi:hypothetical protein
MATATGSNNHGLGFGKIADHLPNSAKSVDKFSYLN